jgi:hypothetical protein
MLSTCRPCRGRRRSIARCAFFLRQLGDEHFGGQQETGNAGGVLQGRAGHLGRVDDAGLHQVFVFARLGVVADIALLGADVLHDRGAFVAGVGGQLTQGLFEGARTMIRIPMARRLRGSVFNGVLAAQQRHTAAGDDAFFDGRAGGVQRVFDAGFLSFISISVAAPTLMTATPPASFARRSCSFSRS